MTLAQNSKNFQAMKEQGLVVPTPSMKPDMPVPPITAPYPNPNFSSGPLPAISMMQPDMQRTFYNPAAAQDRLAPPSATNNAVTGAQAISQTILNVGSGGSGPLLETNNQKNAVQSVLNLVAGTNISLSSDARGDVTIASTASGASDGLTHMRTPWETDPAAVILVDEFISNAGAGNTSSQTNIGSLGWFISGNASNLGDVNGALGGVPPYLGQYNWANTGTITQTGFLTFPGGNLSGNFSQVSWALFDNPGWVMTFVFRVEPANNSSSRHFVFTKKALYVGLMGNTGSFYASNSSSSRPAIFIGIRYDTSTTAPSINDSFYTLEVVVNNEPTTSARNNTQGTTFVTSVAPATGVWHRLDIICNTAGKVTLTLDGSNTNTLTTTVPTYTLSGSISALAGNGNAHVFWTASSLGQGAWGTGSQITLAGFSTGALNSTFEAAAISPGTLDFDSSLTIGSDTGSSISGFPSVVPVFGFGNDDTAAPTANTASISVDYWSFAWNPNLGPSAPGTPVITKPRGW